MYFKFLTTQIFIIMIKIKILKHKIHWPCFVNLHAREPHLIMYLKINQFQPSLSCWVVNILMSMHVISCMVSRSQWPLNCQRQILSGCFRPLLHINHYPCSYYLLIRVHNIATRWQNRLWKKIVHTIRKNNVSINVWLKATLFLWETQVRYFAKAHTMYN